MRRIEPPTASTGCSACGKDLKAHRAGHRTIMEPPGVIRRVVTIRPASIEDLEGITALENWEIEHGLAHFGEVPLVLSETRQSFEARGMHPWFVATQEGQVVGFARSGPWKKREAYRWTCEIGVYVAGRSHGQGIGKALYESLFPALEAAGFRTVLAGIALPNPASVKLHERFGMKQVGLLPSNGFKSGQWIDVGYWARRIGPEGDPPAIIER